ncbi:type II toxin-antitoxin system HicB family antitoxin [Christensenella intestinihominis]|uniref:type II toxin-antitoxin system HicB family antitoxin n=1 Tax=Christensenella intestinihominis TaxID=1851429 RepID=UPI000834A225|nr:hypothetical protein [Christensenella intestinihominis]
MCKYSYPAVFKKECSMYIGHFPDLECPVSFGHSLEDAYEMAEEELSIYLYGMEAAHVPLPHPSVGGRIPSRGENVIFICVDTADISAD